MLSAGSDLVWTLVSGPTSVAALIAPALELPRREAPTVDLGPPDVYSPPERLEARAHLTGGSFRKLRVQFQLTEVEAGTELVVRLELETGNDGWLGFLVKPATRAMVASRLQHSADGLRTALGGVTHRALRPPPLDPEVYARLKERLKGAPPQATAALIQRLQSAPLAVQSTLKPREIAAQEGLPLAQVVEVLTLGVRTGLLELEWVPMCAEAGIRATEAHKIAETGVHCEVCGIRLDGQAPDAMEAVFHPRSSVRPEIATVTQVRSRSREPIEVGEHILNKGGAEIPLELSTGRVHLRIGEQQLNLDVGPEHEAATILTLEITDSGIRLQPGRTAPGTHRLRVDNQSRRSVLQITRTWRPWRPLTASAWLRDRELGQLLAAAHFGPGCEAIRGTVLVAQGKTATPRRTIQAIFEHLATPERVVKLSNTHVAAVFSDGSRALEAMEQAVARQLSVGIGVGTGVIVRTGATRPQILGRAMDRAQEALASAGPPQIAVHEASIADIREMITAHDRVVTLQHRDGQPWLLAFAAVIDGAPELDLMIEPLPASFAPGPITEVAGMKVISELDRGGVGVVLEVEDPESGDHWAAKVIHSHLADERYLQLFYKEGYYASQIQHPNVVALKDWGEDDGRPYLMMELLQGHTLFAEVRKHGTLDLPRTRDVLAALLDGLSAIHIKGLVHRDVKPHNIFLLDSPEQTPHGVKLIDFGLMRRAGKSSSEQFSGTPEFMAPEQLLLGSVDGRTDVYSVGALAYFAYTGRIPFRGNTRGEGAVQRLEGTLREGLDPSILGPLEPIITRAMKVDPNDRWATATQMSEALKSLPL